VVDRAGHDGLLEGIEVAGADGLSECSLCGDWSDKSRVADLCSPKMAESLFEGALFCACRKSTNRPYGSVWIEPDSGGYGLPE